jgi:hypothetical protein
MEISEKIQFEYHFYLPFLFNGNEILFWSNKNAYLKLVHLGRQKL